MSRLPEEIDGIPVIIGDIYIRPMFEVVDVSEDIDSSGWEDAARWPEPLFQHILHSGH